MGWNRPDPYYQPEAFGLTLIGEVDFDAGSYGFSIVALWKHDDGRFFLGEDSGCSCPSPFEDFHDIESLEPATYAHLQARLGFLVKDGEYGFGCKEEVARLLELAREAGLE